MADFIVIMRGYDSVGDQYVYWQSDGFDSSGADYTGPPAFGTLTGVTAIKQSVVEVPLGFSAFVIPFDPTQEVDQTTEQTAQYDTVSEDDEAATYQANFAGTGPPVPDVATFNHPLVNQEYEEDEATTEFLSTHEWAPQSLHQFEAI